MDNPVGKKEIPFTFGIQVRVILGGIVAGTCRAILETPLDYAKTHRQIGQNWKLKNVFTVSRPAQCSCFYRKYFFYVFL